MHTIIIIKVVTSCLASYCITFTTTHGIDNWNFCFHNLLVSLLSLFTKLKLPLAMQFTIIFSLKPDLVPICIPSYYVSVICLQVLIML